MVKYSINENCLKQTKNVITKPNIQNYTHISNEISVPQTQINKLFTASKWGAPSLMYKCKRRRRRILSCKSGIQNKHGHSES